MRIPKLRFPEFDGEWVEKKLGEVSTFSKGKGISKLEIEEDGKYECVRYGELYTVYNETIKDTVSRTSTNRNDLIFSEENDVIIPASGETQIDIAKASCVLKKGIALGGDLNIIKSNLNGVFLSYYLNSKKKKDIANLAQGISVVHLYSSQLSTLNIGFPKLPEQQKIADFLTSVDKKIELLTKKKELLEQYKKGVMQKIFSQEIRFKDDNGNDYPDWEEKKLGDVAEISNGLTLEQNNQNIGYKVTRIETISDGKINLNKVGNVETDKNITANKLTVGDILFSNINSVAHIGKIAFYEKDYNLYHGMNLLNIRTKQEYCYPLFVYFRLSSNEIKKYFEKVCNQAVSQASINQTDLKNTKLKLPLKEEQQKIANFLSAIDKKIEITTTQLDKMKIWKKGLLQKMFA